MLSAVHASKVIIGHDVAFPVDGLVKVLIDYGFEARPAHDGGELVELAEQWRPQGAIIDLAIPGMPSLDVARRLRSTFGPAMRLVGFTGWSAAHYREQAFEAGFDDVVSNPADPAEILLALSGPGAALVERSRAALFDQACGMITLGHRLVDRLAHLKEAQERQHTLALARRALQWSSASLGMAPMVEENRAEIERDLRSLADRLAEAETA